MISFTVPGKPQGKQRARKGPHGFYTPDETKNYQIEVGWQAKRAGATVQDGAVSLTIRAYFRTNRDAMVGMPCLKRPDTDNIEKIVMDALTGIAYFDDAQVYKTDTAKLYGKDEQLEVEIRYA